MRALRVAAQKRGADGTWTESGNGIGGENHFDRSRHQPNTVLSRERAGVSARRQVFSRHRRRRRAGRRREGDCEARARSGAGGASPDGRFISYFGDVHPSFSATWSRRSGARSRPPDRESRLAEVKPATGVSDAEFLAGLNDSLRNRARGYPAHRQ
jgi:hypothetical protein